MSRTEKNNHGTTEPAAIRIARTEQLAHLAVLVTLRLSVPASVSLESRQGLAENLVAYLLSEHHDTPLAEIAMRRHEIVEAAATLAQRHVDEHVAYVREHEARRARAKVTGLGTRAVTGTAFALGVAGGALSGTARALKTGVSRVEVRSPIRWRK